MQPKTMKQSSLVTHSSAKDLEQNKDSRGPTLEPVKDEPKSKELS
jgi:hypothetical protein